MAEFKDVIKQRRRMCDTYSIGVVDCKKCPIAYENNGVKRTCDLFIREYPGVAERLILDWAEAHPEPKRPMRWELFAKLFPNGDINNKPCPCCIYKDHVCVAADCDKCKNEYWNDEAEDGFGGYKMGESK